MALNRHGHTPPPPSSLFPSIPHCLATWEWSYLVGQDAGAVHRLGLDLLGPRQLVTLRTIDALGQKALRVLCNDVAILRVDLWKRIKLYYKWMHVDGCKKCKKLASHKKCISTIIEPIRNFFPMYIFSNLFTIYFNRILERTWPDGCILLNRKFLWFHLLVLL